MLGRPHDTGLLTLGAISFTAEGILEGAPLHPTTAVPRASIERICLRYGFLTRHPLILALFGLVLIGLGLLPLVHLAAWLIRGGVIVNIEMLAVVWLFLGIAALWEAFRRGYTLDIKTAGGWKRLEFGRGIRPPEVEAFVKQAEQSFGYSVESLLA